MRRVTFAVRGLTAGTAILFSLAGIFSAGALAMPAQPQTAVRILLIAHNNAQYPCVRAHWKHNENNAFGPRCPVTPRLRRWLRSHPIGPSGGAGTPPPPYVLGDEDPICRCQNDVRTVGFHTDSITGGVARVTATITFYLAPQRITFVLLHAADGWRVDNTYCAGRPQTSVYKLNGRSGTHLVRCP